MPEFQGPMQLNIKCMSADCENELHCYCVASPRAG